MKSRYDVINPITKKQESWTGAFDSEKEEKEWYNTHGKEWEAQGKKLIRVECMLEKPIPDK